MLFFIFPSPLAWHYLSSNLYSVYSETKSVTRYIIEPRSNNYNKAAVTIKFVTNWER